MLDPLIKKVELDREKGFNPEIVVVSGDIAFKGVAAEYAKAKSFFDKLLNTLELPSQRLFVVPGNHDVNRKRYRKSDIPRYENVQDLNEELGDEYYREDLLKGMEDYFGFIRGNYPHLISRHGDLVPFVRLFKSRCKKRIGLVGLNSSWMCRTSDDKGEIVIGEYQVVKAMEELKELGEPDLLIHIFHHPLDWLWPEDLSRIRHHLNDSIVLSGHLHEAAGGHAMDLDGRLFTFQAGGAYLGSESDWPARYQYITLDWQEDQIELDFRKYVKGKRRWVIDSETGDDGKKSFPMAVMRRAGSGTAAYVSIPAGETAPQWPELYCDWLKENYSTLDADKLFGKGKAFSLDLPEVYIPLYGNDPGKKSREAAFLLEDGKKDREDALLREQEKPVGIDILIANNDSLLVGGHAGSGKTTLMKHMACSLAVKDDAGTRVAGMEGVLPVPIILKDLNAYFEGVDSRKDRDPDRELTDVDTAEQDTDELLSWYFRKKMAGTLSIATVNRFIEAGRVVFLLDGLDELKPKYRDGLVSLFADLRIKHKGNRIVLTSRPHGIGGAAVKRFGDKRTEILSLNMEQVREFIGKWFLNLYRGRAVVGRKNAEAMISEINSHPAVSVLIDNPLMLTAICILYYDDKELPGQRAELYKKFIDNLLYRRFSESEKVHDYLKTLAFRMHEDRLRNADRTHAVDILKTVYKRKPGESEKEYNRRADGVFSDIEPKCGLLKFESGQYSFWHLTFQEFLTAAYIVDNRSDHVGAIEAYWGKDWYREVIELYIGYLSIENRSRANDIVSSIVEAEDRHPFGKWRQAAHALIDIHGDRRDDNVLERSRERMQAIFRKTDKPEALVDAGEILGRLGDPRDLREFIRIEGGKYDLEELGKTTLQPFEIGKYPVTNGWFDEFINAGGYDNKDFWSPQGSKWLEKNGAKQPEFWFDRKWNCPNAPVVGVTWYEAYAFTRWLTSARNDGYTYRLLSEWEWQAWMGLKKT